MRMKTLGAASIIMLLAGPVYAQGAVQRYGEKDKDKTWADMEREKEAERAYRRSLGNVPDKGPVDPWGNARSVEAPKGEAKAAAKTDAKTAPAKPKTKTGDTAK
jgi:hypothetical protein